MKKFLLLLGFSLLSACATSAPEPVPQPERGPVDPEMQKFYHELSQCLYPKMSVLAEPIVPGLQISMAGKKNVSTVLGVDISKDGSVQTVTVLKGSEIQDLDNLGIDTFRACSPLPISSASLYAKLQGRVTWQFKFQK